MKRVLILGGYGTFGSIVARELARAGIVVTVAGRDSNRAVQLATQLGRPHTGMAVDLNDMEKLHRAIVDHAVVANCAGPFSRFDQKVLDACLATQRHYVDIADDRRYIGEVRKRDAELRAGGVTALFGCSSLPSISGALGLLIRRKCDKPLEGVRVTLFIGNDNPKGFAAVSSLVSTLGQPIATPQGGLRVFRDGTNVRLPPPFGRRFAYHVESPEYDLFSDLFGVRLVIVGVSFELRISNFLMTMLARLPFRYGPNTARILSAASKPLRRIGCSGGAVMTELFDARGVNVAAAIVARDDGQRMAALPCVLAVQALIDGAERPGAGAAYDLLDPEDMLKELERRGFELLAPF